MTLILGVNAYHADSSAAIVRDGKLVAAVEEERFRRIKHWAGVPTESIKYCLKAAGAQMRDVDHIAMNRLPKANMARRLAYVATNAPSWKMVAERITSLRKVASFEETLKDYFADEDITAYFHPIEHHRAHMASAFLVCPYEQAVVVSVDGMGDFASTAWGVGWKNTFTIDGRVYFPNSLGMFYTAMTQYLGFPHYGDEYKVMGLAPYGEPKYMTKMREIVRLRPDGTYRLNMKYFRHGKESNLYRWESGVPELSSHFTPALEDLLGPARKKGEDLTQYHKDLARSTQAMYEEAFFHLLNTLYQTYGASDLTIAGGCGMNSVANGRVYRNTPFKRVYIQSAAGDAGGAVGAAYSVWADIKPDAPRFHMSHAMLGPEYTNEEIEQTLNKHKAEIEKQNCKVEKIADEGELCRRTAAEVAKGRVIGWFQGRMEWGPRALGGRSIIGDPRRADMKDILNHKIKRRESFRPFAPSILREAAPEWFETDDEVPFMMQVFQIREEKRSLIPAVTHVDGSGRLQTVRKEDNPIYYRLIEAFRDQTGVPLVLNTSFNENEPVVCQPEEALACFLRTNMDVLVLGNWFVERKEG